MALTYTVGGSGKPGKPKKTKKAKRQPTAEEVGAAGRAARMKMYDTPKEKKRVATLMEVNTQTPKAIAKGLELNEYGAPKGEQKHKRYGSMFVRQKAKEPGRK